MGNINRMNSAVEFLEDNKPLKVENLWLVRINETTIGVYGTSNYAFKQNMNRNIALEELMVVKEEYNFLKREAKIFSEYVENKQIEFGLYIDYGRMGSELVCKEKGGAIEFFI